MKEKNILHPQEIELFFLIPAIRKEIALFMKAKGLKNKDIAERLFITEAAISQYIKNKRANNIKFDSTFRSEIEKAVDKIIDKNTMIKEMQRLINIARDQRIICKLHANFSNIPNGCKLCFER